MSEPEDVPSFAVRKELRELGVIVVGAIIIAFLVNLFTSILYGYITGGKLYPEFFIPTLASIAGLMYILYRYAIVPHTKIRKHMTVSIIYDINEGEIVQDPFDGYYAQQIAKQAFDKYRQNLGEGFNEIKTTVHPHDTKKHILTELMEYLVMMELVSAILMSDKRGLKQDTCKEMPIELANNRFISFFKTSDPSKIANLGMQQLDLSLPNDFAVKYESPLTGRKDLNSFQITLSGNYCDIVIVGHMSSMWKIGSMTTGPLTVFEGIYIRDIFREGLLKRLGSLWRVRFTIHVELRLKLRGGLLLNLAYLDWAGKLSEQLVSGGPFGSLDFPAFQGSKINGIITEIYAMAKQNNKLLQKLDRNDEDTSEAGNDP